jgi:hypothetical protein
MAYNYPRGVKPIKGNNRMKVIAGLIEDKYKSPSPYNQRRTL